MATSAPSFAKAMAIAWPIPLSPPVINAFLPFNFPAARYSGSSVCGVEWIFSLSSS